MSIEGYPPLSMLSSDNNKELFICEFCLKYYND
jgi:hypothetical protein